MTDREDIERLRGMNAKLRKMVEILTKDLARAMERRVEAEAMLIIHADRVEVVDDSSTGSFATVEDTESTR